MANQTITIRVNTDVTYLGDDATRDDLEAYSNRLAARISEEFGVKVHLVWYQGARSCDCPEHGGIDARLREIAETDEWMEILREAQDAR